MSSVLHLHDAVLPDPQKCLDSCTVKLKVSIPHSTVDKLKMDKHIGLRVCDMFGEERFHGEVTEVRFHEIYAQYMYHVTYTDGDEQDYWKHELDMITCRCDPDDDST